jgi:hypothetical protein
MKKSEAYNYFVPNFNLIAIKAMHKHVKMLGKAPAPEDFVDKYLENEIAQFDAELKEGIPTQSDIAEEISLMDKSVNRYHSEDFGNMQDWEEKSINTNKFSWE